MLLLALAVAATRPVAEAEQAFAAAAQRDGQWRAFKDHSAPGAVMLAPDLVDAKTFLEPLVEPKVAVMWWPARTVTSCDGALAFSTGPWRRDGGRQAGRYFMIWQRQPDGNWAWIYDGGTEDGGAMPVGDRPVAVRAACRGKPAPVDAAGGVKSGASPDGSFHWRLDKRDRPYRLTVSYRTARGWGRETAAVG